MQQPAHVGLQLAHLRAVPLVHLADPMLKNPFLPGNNLKGPALMSILMSALSTQAALHAHIVMRKGRYGDQSEKSRFKSSCRLEQRLSRITSLEQSLFY